jgi:hypothetical protein
MCHRCRNCHLIATKPYLEGLFPEIPEQTPAQKTRNDMPDDLLVLLEKGQFPRH